MSAKAHYENHLAYFYIWMCGDREKRQREFTEFLLQHQLKPAASGNAIDFGAGHGLQAIPLTQAGFEVLAVDFNLSLLDELNQHKAGLKIETHCDDMRNVLKHAALKPELILCCGDTLLHLDSKNEIRQFLSNCISILETGGKLVLSFRDYSTELKETQRFIPVKSDENRILTCFLEYEPDFVNVTDLLYEKEEAGWKQKVSSYKKARMTPAEIKTCLNELQAEILSEEMQRGMITLVIQK